MKALITGIRGFVGQYLASELAANGYTVYGIDLVADKDTACVSLLDSQAVRDHICVIQPDVLYHLAAQASVPISWVEPQNTYDLNVIGAINLLEAVRMAKNACRIIIIGSSDQYGVIDSSEPISENMPSHPQNPYAASKKAQEDIAIVYTKSYSMDICFTRSFNHSGPGQRLGFLIPDLCHGIVQVERGISKHLKVGNLEAVRDFTDVRDIVRAYRMIGTKGKTGEIYNVGTGVGHKAKDILDILISIARCEIHIMQDKDRMRISDTPVLVCDNNKLRSHTGWMPSIPIEITLQDTIEYYRSIG